MDMARRKSKMSKLKITLDLPDNFDLEEDSEFVYLLHYGKVVVIFNKCTTKEAIMAEVEKLKD